MNLPSVVAPVLLDLPVIWREDLQLQLTSNENVLAWLEVDLDAALYFGRGLLALTSERLLWQPVAAPQTWHSLPLQPDMRLAGCDPR